MFVAELLLALPLLLTLHTFEEDPDLTERSHQLTRPTKSNRASLYLTQKVYLVLQIIYALGGRSPARQSYVLAGTL